MSIKFTILGCGSSMGVPRADGFWGNCNPLEKKNNRTRCSALISNKNCSILLDTSENMTRPIAVQVQKSNSCTGRHILPDEVLLLHLFQ